jgi:hypothetical protein
MGSWRLWSRADWKGRRRRRWRPAETKKDEKEIVMKMPTAKPSQAYPPLRVQFIPAVKVALEKAAKDDSRPVSSLVQKIVADWLEANGYLK